MRFTWGNLIDNYVLVINHVLDTGADRWTMIRELAGDIRQISGDKPDYFPISVAKYTDDPEGDRRLMLDLLALRYNERREAAHRREATR